jgi:hypothetical protein
MEQSYQLPARGERDRQNVDRESLKLHGQESKKWKLRNSNRTAAEFKDSKLESSKLEPASSRAA